MKKTNSDWSFLENCGEMGKRILEKDWSLSAMGSIDSWPQSLYYTLSIVLKSQFPMFVFWGPEWICFYNDASLPSLGTDGKHPNLLGMDGKTGWKEIWHIIHPLLVEVSTTQLSISKSDQLIPIYRNGHLEKVYWTFSYSPILDQQATNQGVLVVCTETTKNVQNLHALESSKNELEFAIEAAKLGTFDYNPITNKFSANARLKKWFGLPEEEQIELHHAIEAIALNDRERVNATLKKTLDYASGGTYDIVFTLVHPITKIQKIIHAKGRAWFNEAKQPYRFNGTVDDVTLQVEDAKLIKESEQRFAAAVQAVDGILWTNNAQGEMEGEQPGWASLTGQTKEEYCGYGWAKAVHPDDAIPTIKAWNNAVAKKETFNFEHRVRTKAGNYKVFSIRAIPLLHTDGTIKEWVGVHTDIQKQKDFASELEKQVRLRTKALAKNNQELAKMNKELQSFTYISSHDLQEPLRKIQLFTARLLEKEFHNLSDHGKEQFNRMRIAAQRMQNLIEDLLAYSRTETTERNFINTNLEELIIGVENDLKEELLHHHATIVVDTKCSIPLIPFQFSQLLHNLISNSLKFSDPNRKPLIKITTIITEGFQIKKKPLHAKIKYCHIRYTDNGIGFKSQYSAKIFELFQQLHGKETFQGTGIGLAIVKKIVENHNGHITATGKVDQGAIFDIYLPSVVKKR